MNPFVVGQADPEELLQRIGSLRRLVEVMVGERLSAERRAALDHALASYYAQSRERSGFRDFYRFLERDDPEGLAKLLRPFESGSLKHLLSDDGDDLLKHEALVTVFGFQTITALGRKLPGPRMLGRGVGEEHHVTALRPQSTGLGQGQRHRRRRPAAREFHHVRQLGMMVAAVLQHSALQP